ncbi:16S rRNA (uracil(1498)-N(3))-methyltransferase [Fusibacter sp. JL216-2]|uniref:16S rRNA (uracil(1498)-N(3))-methyltransferase n=1 Tax=Fusibacter sp. JL216-2 TaxID=3071453 RepID=UPI003D344D3E
MHRFFISKTNLNEELQTARIIDKDDIKHASKALRIEIDEKVELCDDSGIEHICQVSEIESEYIECRILSSEKNKRESPIEITLFQGFPKSDKLELIIQKTTELGVVNVVPVQMKRSVAKWKNDKSASKKIMRWNKIGFEAAKQSKRGRIPVVKEPLTVNELCSELEHFDLVILPYENESAKGIDEVISGLDSVKSVAVIIGPEGGFAEEEVACLSENGANSVKIGPRILRTETAGVVSVALVQYALGDLGNV